MAGSLGDLGGLLRQAQKMQQRVQELQASLEKRSFEGKAGGGAVRATVTGARQLVDLKIDKAVVNPQEVELLEDLVATAVKEALRLADETAKSEMQRITGGLGLPGMM